MREEEKNRSSQGSSFRRFFKKRWVFPAIYIASAAIILTGVLWYQSNDNANDKIDNSASDLAGKKSHDQEAVPVNRLMENIIMPVTESDKAVIKMPFYDFDGEDAKQEAALVFYNNAYHPNTGIDIVMENDKSFDVVAALSGTVVEVKEDALLGNSIEVEHDKGIVTQYQSVRDIMIEVGDTVEQGQTLAKAGKSLYNEAAGTHLHFEIRKDSVPVNPEEYFNKPLSALQDAKNADESNVDSGDSKDEGKSEEKTNADTEEGAEEDKDASSEKDAADKKEAAEDEEASEEGDASKDEDKDASEDSDAEEEDDASDEDESDAEENSKKPTSLNS